MRLAGQAKGGFYPTPPSVTELIDSHLSGPYGDSSFRILDPCCGEGDAAAMLGTSLNGAESFGIELHAERAEEARNKLDHVVSGDLFKTSIANAAFGLLFLNPPYDHDPEESRTEHAFLNQTLRYLQDKGVLVYIVPMIRLARSAKLIASQFHSVSCYRFPDPEWDDFNQVVLFGVKRSVAARPDQVAHMIQAITNWSQGLDLQTLRRQPWPRFHAPEGRLGDILFATRAIDPTEAANAARERGLWSQREAMEAFQPSEDNRTRPLMPLRKGHMAMLVAAGFLNNLVLEHEGERVLVKGRTTKEKVLVDQTDEKETFRDKMKTTVVTVNLDSGEFEEITTS